MRIFQKIYNIKNKKNLLIILYIKLRHKNLQKSKKKLTIYGVILIGGLLFYALKQKCLPPIFLNSLI